MNRRTYLGVVGAAAAGGLAGCGGGGESETIERTFYVGDTVESAGVQLEIREYALVSRYVTYDTFDETYPEDEAETPPTAGGIFLFAHLVVENVGDKRREFPDVGRGIRGTYNEQEVEFFEPDAMVKSDQGDEYQSYSALAQERDVISEGAFPGVTIDGWVICEVPRALDPRDLRFRTTLPAEGGRTTRRWSFGNATPVITPEGYDRDIPTVTPTPTPTDGG